MLHAEETARGQCSPLQSIPTLFLIKAVPFLSDDQCQRDCGYSLPDSGPVCGCDCKEYLVDNENTKIRFTKPQETS